MQINIKLDTDFEDALQDLMSKDEHSTNGDFAKLNGFAESQLSYTDFIDNFIDKKVVADASIDGNANVGHKDIVSLQHEMGKPHSKLLSFNKIFYEIKKKYGLKVACEWLKAEWYGNFYMHDAFNSSQVPYCFSGDTKILTKDGIKRLDELVDKDIMVLGKKQAWEKATVKHFGKAPLKRLIVKRLGNTKEILVTGNHIWFEVNKNGNVREISTDDLKPGMRLKFNIGRSWKNVYPSPFGIAHGFYIGDGDKGKHSRANFCGDKTSLIPYYTPGNVYGNEREYSIGGIPNYFKQLPSINESSSYLYGWLAGYFAADGCVDTVGRCTLSSTNKEYLEFARDVLCVLGMPVNQIRYQDRVSNLTGEMGRIYILTLSSEYLKEDFFIRPKHKERFIEVERKNKQWIVESISETNIVDDIYCAVVPGSESFTLDGNLLTHNCFAYDLEKVVNEGLFFMHPTSTNKDEWNIEEDSEYNSARPPKHLTTYTDFVAEFTSWCCNRSSGAVGLPSYLVYSYYFWKKDVEEGYYQKSPEYYRDQEFQRIIYKLNQPYLREGIQSA